MFIFIPHIPFWMNSSVISALFFIIIKRQEKKKLDTEIKNTLNEDGNDDDVVKGFLCRFPQLVTYAPFTLFPSPVPKAVFRQALEVQTHYNTLVDRISQDSDFLREALQR